MNALLVTILATVATFWAVFIAASEEQVFRQSCGNSEITYHPKILMSYIEDTDTGRCSYRASLSSRLAADDSALSRAAAILLEAAKLRGKPDFADMIEFKFASTLSEAFDELLVTFDGAAELRMRLAEQGGTLAACAKKAIVSGELFNRSESLVLTCGFDEKVGNYFFNVAFNNLRMQVLLPAA